MRNINGINVATLKMNGSIHVLSERKSDKVNSLYRLQLVVTGCNTCIVATYSIPKKHLFYKASNAFIEIILDQ